MEWQVVLALVLAVPIILFPVAYIWYLNIGGIYAAIRKSRVLVAIGRAMPIVLKVATPVGVYGFLIWLFLARAGWQVALALALAVPLILVPVAFTWYLTVSGLYRVMRDARQREKRRAKAAREAQQLARALAAEVATPRRAG